MLAAAKVLSRVQGHGITLVPDGNRLRFHPAAALTTEMIDELRRHKETILKILRRREERRQDTSPPGTSVGEVLQLAREVLVHPQSRLWVMSCSAAHKELTEQIDEVLGGAPKFLCPLPRRSPDHALGTVEDPVTPPVPPGRDPLVHRDSDKGKFFHGDWRQTWPHDYRVHRGGES